MEIQKSVGVLKTRWYNKKDGLVIGQTGMIRVPGFFANKTIKVSFKTDDESIETIDKKVFKSGLSGLILVNKKYISKIATLEFNEGDIIEYFKSRFEDKHTAIGNGNDTQHGEPSIHA